MTDTHTYPWNRKLLELKKVEFLTSCKISTLSVLSTLDWAMQVSRQTDIAVVSGFHSKMERDVLKLLLQWQCGNIVVLARGMYRKLPKQYEEAIFKTTSSQSLITRINHSSFRIFSSQTQRLYKNRVIIFDSPLLVF